MPASLALRSSLLLGAILLGGSACDKADEYLNTKKGEQVIAEWFEKQDMMTTSVGCPRDIAIKDGTSFECKVMLANADGLEVQVEVVMTNGKGDIDMRHQEPLLAAARVERGIAGGLKDQGLEDISVDCGARVRLSVPGNTFECKAHTKNEDFQVQVTIKDEAGNWGAQRL